jgi:hypothetical protein
MLEVGRKFENGGMEFKILEVYPKTCKIQFTKSHYIMIDQRSRILATVGYYGVNSLIHDPFAPSYKGVGCLGISVVPHLRDRKDRAMTKAVDKLWPMVLDDHLNGIEVPNAWLNKASFEEWLVEDYGDRWKEFVEQDMRLLPLGKHGRKISALVDVLTYKKWKCKRGVSYSQGNYRVLFNGSLIGSYVDKRKALETLLKHVKEVEVGDKFRNYLDNCIPKLEREIECLA